MPLNKAIDVLLAKFSAKYPGSYEKAEERLRRTHVSNEIFEKFNTEYVSSFLEFTINKESMLCFDRAK
ncbi:MAG: hypothetical protein ACTS73_06320 [Arsenophonus sp. NEOnobi-MAG3]